MSALPLPHPAAGRSLSVSEAIEAGFIPKPDEDVVDMFMPSELRLYRHVQDHRYAHRKGYPMLSHFRLSISSYVFCTGMWTVDELKDMIALLQQADFDPTDGIFNGISLFKIGSVQSW